MASARENDLNPNVTIGLSFPLRGDAFNDFAETFHIINDVSLPMIDFDIHVLDTKHNDKTLESLIYD